MKILDSFSEKKKIVNPNQKIGIYVCGITPYDTTHLGHAFTFITYDVLVRYLRFLDAKVTYVQNITDIDDSILSKSKSLNISWKKLGEEEIEKHLNNMDSLKALRPDFYPKATEHINEMIKIINVLIQKKLAYVKNGSVYFEVKKDKNFGKLSKLGYRAQLEIANERGNFPLDPNKKDPLDFVLWQTQKPGEPSWDSPWGRGRPGWHIECSAMSMKYLGPTITIHGGGKDLIFPHHEAEIAQSENYTGRKFVDVWVHTEMVYCDGNKMSKSLGNMIFVSDLIKKYTTNQIRLFLLSHHFSEPWEYNEQEFKEAIEIDKILGQKTSSKTSLSNQQTKKSLPSFFDVLDDNLNTPKAIKMLVNFAKSDTPKAPEVIFKCSQILGLKY